MNRMNWFKERDRIKTEVVSIERQNLTKKIREELKDAGLVGYPFTLQYVNPRDEMQFEFSNIVIEYKSRLGGWRFDTIKLESVTFEDIKKLMKVIEDLEETK